MNGRAVVIGGGVIGAACAHYLNRSNWQVTVVERKLSAAALPCKLRFDFSEPHLAIAGPWSHGQNVEGDVSPNSPFSIRPRLDLSLWSWMVQFARHCNTKDLIAGGKTLQSMLNSSRMLYGELSRTNRSTRNGRRKACCFHSSTTLEWIISRKMTGCYASILDTVPIDTMATKSSNWNQH